MTSVPHASMTGVGGISAPPRIRLHQVLKRFGGRTVVDVSDLGFGRHRIEGLIGPNGAGKTTLVRLIIGALQLDRGDIYYLGDSGEFAISGRRPHEIAGLGIVKSNQVMEDFASLTIKESMQLSLASPNEEKFYRILRGDSRIKDEVEAEIAQYIDYFEFGNPDRHVRSAGEKKLLDIIRCLLLKPRFLLLDEPTAGLPKNQTEKIMDLLCRKTVDEGLNVLLIEHDLEFVWEICDFIHFMNEGRILVQGPPSEIRQNATVIETYLGSGHA